MSYTSKFTGEEIDNLLSSISDINITKKVLWEGDLDTQNESVTLSESLENFDYLVLSVKHMIVSNGVDYVRYLPDTWIETSKIKSTGYKYGTTEPIFLTPTYSDPINNVMRQASYTFSSSTTVRCEVIQLLGSTAGTMSAHLTKVIGIKFIQSSLVGNSASNPIGSILPVMGIEAPQDYLICDGRELNINEYKELANYFEKQFGSKNYFGGDGNTTFSIPDLRNEFLRGYGDKSSDIGIHQDGTKHPYFATDSNTHQIYHRDSGYPTEMDEEFDTTTTAYTLNSSTIPWNTNSQKTFTSRPTNVAVLFCIKYTEGQKGNSHPIYTDLISDNITTKGKHTLLDSLFNYDEILVEGYVPTTTGVRSYKHSIRIVPTDIEGQVDYEFAINMASESSAATYLILFGFDTDGRTLLVQGFHATGGWSSRNIGISKIQGIKY